ncbi:alanine racemase [Belliella aquatica]|uniref:Alanine racemase n=1 Tax=Belliella aquatica TaxID=1323734 RepID=A0ABQ1M7D8_9BACT|nr:alanine racemase [Belliella aquatica]MCH7405557.1 alanine racemase [Belliella aquatica]GGC35948.1 alanine racemase [Belliella aquatica]
MSYLSQITSPTLLINEAICRNNLQTMANKAKKHGLKLIPHFKTGQSKAIGKWAKEYGITEITVSSIKMAKYFCQNGWENIHIAFPFNPLEIELLQELTKQNKISIQLVNEAVAESLNMSLDFPVEFFIEIDAGYGRTGVEATDFGMIEGILRKAKESEKLIFKGFYIHAGHSYYEKDISKIYEETRLALNMLKTKYSSEYPYLVTRIGDTPGCSTMEDFGDIDEMGPGNFVFYDLTQAQIGSCQKSDIAVALAAPVVDIKKDKKTILVHAGGVHLAKDVLMESDGSKNFGEIVFLNENGWTMPESRSFVKSISQEHGIIQASDELLEKIKVGDLLGILPVHSCMTADCMKSYLSLDGQWLDHAEGSSQV